MKKLTLDYSIWRAPGMGYYNVGKGDCNLHNNEGNMCVLGQFIPQMSEKTTHTCIKNKGTPQDLAGPIEHLSEKIGVKPEGGLQLRNTQFATDVMQMNDSTHCDPYAKIEYFKKRFAEIGYEIEVINQPPVIG